MRKDIYILLTIWGIISSGLFIYFWGANQKLEKRELLFNESISLHKQAIANEVKSYNAINDCFVVRRGLCDAQEFKDTLQVLGDEADGIYNQIVDIETQLR